MRHPKWTSAASAALLLVSTVGLAGCGDDSDLGSMPGTQHGDKPTNPAGEHNDADVAFSGHMILHHQQAVQMADIAGWQATNAGTKKLATAIKAAQEPEMRQMSAWLTGWGKPVPSPSHGGHEMEDSIPGMMTEDEMHAMGQAEGPEFDRMWIQMMIKHHQGAVAMAKTERASGKNSDAIALAKKIETAQTADIANLKRLLGQINAS